MFFNSFLTRNIIVNISFNLPVKINQNCIFALQIFNMTVQFFKYQGAGNDFVIIDNRNSIFNKDTENIKLLCNRRFGIGADGLILLENDPINSSDFAMIYYNADGNESSMCGNGGRCIVAFAKYLNMINESCEFTAIDGLHRANLVGEEVDLQMQNVNKVYKDEQSFFLDTGSPHHIEFTTNLFEFPLLEQGRKIRHDLKYQSIEGTNVNFAEQVASNTFKVRTYERGVEDETLACGTGVTAVAIAAHQSKLTQDSLIHLDAMGGKLSVRFVYNEVTETYSNVWLKGPAVQVFKGEIEC